MYGEGFINRLQLILRKNKKNIYKHVITQNSIESYKVFPALITNVIILPEGLLIF